MNKILQLHLDNPNRIRPAAQLVVNAAETSLYLYDVISADWGISAEAVVNAIAEVPAGSLLNVYINCPGGDVFEARAIMAALDRFPGRSLAHIDSLCASAATSVALACDEIEMADNALWMIHNASGAVWGDKNDMRSMADLLEKVEIAIVDDYCRKTGKPRRDMMDLMDAETWMTAQEALDMGFIDRIKKRRDQPGNAWNLSAYGKAPPAAVAPPQNPEPTPQPAPAPAADMTHNTNRLRLVRIF